MTEGQESIREAIATRLREARKVAGLSQGQVARLLVMHRPTISEIEAGNRRVSAEELTKVSQRLTMSLCPGYWASRPNNLKPMTHGCNLQRAN